MTPIRTWLVEADADYRLSLKMALDLEERIAVEQVFPTGSEFFEGLQSESAPDVVLMDLDLPGMSSLEAIRKLARVSQDLGVIGLTALEDNDKVLLAALVAGAAGCLSKDSGGPAISTAVQDVFWGGAALSPAIARMVVEQFRKPSPAGEFDLSQREIDVLQKLVDGLSVKEISAALNVSVGTIGFHLTNIYKKLGVQSQTGAVVKAVRAGII